ncbi:hypothetical protein [Delftia acidovorans]|uniref:Uncharacterized protein n=1 Tax=Delftia acidovorans TaxID=80866 RepID=A0AAJ2VD07_DELAC|nr:hypothetical protein [Delftia acidovorans]MDX4954312.1 hypothetical protein [Delftia acidovorans]
MMIIGTNCVAGKTAQGRGDHGVKPRLRLGAVISWPGSTKHSRQRLPGGDQRARALFLYVIYWTKHIFVLDNSQNPSKHPGHGRTFCPLQINDATF